MLPPSRPPAPPLRRNGAFRLLWTAQCLSQLGFYTGIVVYPLLVLTTDGGALWAGVLGFTASAAGLAARLPAGLACDRFDRRRLLLGAALCRAAAMALLAVGCAAGTVPLPLLLVVAAVDGGMLEVARYAERAALRHVVRPGDLTAAVSGNEARGQAAGLAGPALGGWLFALAPALPFAGNAAAHLLAAGLVTRVRGPLQGHAEGRAGGEGHRIEGAAGEGAGDGRPGRDRPRGDRPRADRPRVLREAARGFALIRADRTLRVLVPASLCPNACFGGVALLIVAAAEGRGDGAAAIGAALSVAGLGGVAGALAAPALLRRLRPSVLLLGALALMPCAVAGLAAAPGPVAAAVLLGACMFTVPVLNAQLTVYQIRRTPDALQGRVFAATAFAMGVTQPLGPLLGGAGYHFLGPTPAFLALAGLLAAGAACVAALPAARRLPPAEAGMGAATEEETAEAPPP
ncbi:MFS transporter [Streptomonospora sp. S1-112]|uniref:MFS transporter n=1 Tax=Streptomonospora mangrovi TaxID=2883123 RepID=A0A9X3NL09_9ACTN|nr:MFS transporter [Streptomonospora mangrovi]MDA0565657.1 MFS transporter [Streptomonospora mangrovi]